MGALFPDTHPAAEQILVDGLRRMSGAARLARACDLREAALSLARVRILERYGELPEREVRLRLASLWLDAALMRRVFGWNPDERGL